jgi:integrase
MMVSKTTNYLTPSLFYNKSLFWLIRLPAFTRKSRRLPMNADSFVRAYRLQYGSGLRISELLNLEKRDVDLKHRLLLIRTAKTGYNQRATILPYDIPMMEKQLASLSNHDKIFPANRHIMWQYAKDAGNLAGLDIGEIQRVKTIDGVWTHLMRKSCSKRMRELGANRELRMLKLRHVFQNSHDTYDAPDLNELLNWEAKHFSTFLINGDAKIEAQK